MVPVDGLYMARLDRAHLVMVDVSWFPVVVDLAAKQGKIDNNRLTTDIAAHLVLGSLHTACNRFACNWFNGLIGLVHASFEVSRE